MTIIWRQLVIRPLLSIFALIGLALAAAVLLPPSAAATTVKDAPAQAKVALKSLNATHDERERRSLKLVSWNGQPVGINYVTMPKTALSSPAEFRRQYIAIYRAINRNSNYRQLFGAEEGNELKSSIMIDEKEGLFESEGPAAFRSACRAAENIARSQEWKIDPRDGCLLDRPGMVQRIGGVIAVEGEHGIRGYLVTTRYDMPTPSSPDAVDDDYVYAFFESGESIGLSADRAYTNYEVHAKVADAMVRKKSGPRSAEAGADEVSGKTGENAKARAGEGSKTRPGEGAKRRAPKSGTYLIFGIGFIAVALVAAVSFIIVKTGLGSGVLGRFRRFRRKKPESLSSLVAGLDDHADQEEGEGDQGDGASAGEPEVEREGEPGEDGDEREDNSGEDR